MFNRCVSPHCRYRLSRVLPDFAMFCHQHWVLCLQLVRLIFSQYTSTHHSVYRTISGVVYLRPTKVTISCINAESKFKVGMNGSTYACVCEHKYLSSPEWKVHWRKLPKSWQVFYCNGSSQLIIRKLEEKSRSVRWAMWSTALFHWHRIDYMCLVRIFRWIILTRVNPLN